MCTEFWIFDPIVRHWAKESHSQQRVKGVHCFTLYWLSSSFSLPTPTPRLLVWPVHSLRTITNTAVFDTFWLHFPAHVECLVSLTGKNNTGCFFLAVRIWGEGLVGHFLPALFCFESGSQLAHTTSTLCARIGPKWLCSKSWDGSGWAFPDELHESSFPW